MFLRVKDGVVNLASIQYIRRVQNTVTIYFKGDHYTITFNTEDEAVVYIRGLSSMLDAKKPEV